MYLPCSTIRRIICGSIILIFFIIACATYFRGCDHVLEPTCVSYYPYNVLVVGYGVYEHTCSSCVAYSKHGCFAYHTWDCFDSYAIAQFVHHGDLYTCHVDVDDDNYNYNAAYYDASSRYQVNQSYPVYIDKVTHKCYTSTEVERLALVGVIFFVLPLHF